MSSFSLLPPSLPPFLPSFLREICAGKNLRLCLNSQQRGFGGDRAPSRLQGGEVHLPPSFWEAWEDEAVSGFKTEYAKHFFYREP